MVSALTLVVMSFTLYEPGYFPVSQRPERQLRIFDDGDVCLYENHGMSVACGHHDDEDVSFNGLGIMKATGVGGTELTEYMLTAAIWTRKKPSMGAADWAFVLSWPSLFLLLISTHSILRRWLRSKDAQAAEHVIREKEARDLRQWLIVRGTLPTAYERCELWCTTRTSNPYGDCSCGRIPPSVRQ